MGALRFFNSLLRKQHNIDQIRDYLKDGTPPTNPKITEEVLKQFESEGDDLVHKDSKRTVVDVEDVPEILQQEYDDMTKSLGLGVGKFYEIVSDLYLNISVNAVRRFLKNQPAYQLTQPYRNVVSKPVLATKVNGRWMIDLVDFNPLKGSNNNYRYVLTCIDVMTRYLFTRPLKEKTAEAVRAALEQIAEEAEATPDILQSDQGGEFKREVSDWCEENDIKQVFVKSYSPRSQGLIEGLNKLLRQKLSDAMVRKGTRQWTKHLQDATTTWNRTPHGGQKHAPDYLYLSNPEDVEEEQKEAVKKLEERAAKAVAKNKVRELQIGDVVRVALTSVSHKARQQRKETGTTKNLIVKWTPETYRIKSVVKPDGSDKRLLPFKPLQKLQYTLESMDGKPLNTERLQTDRAGLQRRAGRFFASELQLVAKKGQPIPESSHLPFDLAKKLNKSDDDGGRAAPPPPPPAPRAPRQPRQPAPPQPPRRGARQRQAPRVPMRDEFEYDD